MAQGLETVYNDEFRAELEQFRENNPGLWKEAEMMVKQNVANNNMSQCFSDEQLENLAYLRLATVMEEKEKR